MVRDFSLKLVNIAGSFIFLNFCNLQEMKADLHKNKAIKPDRQLKDVVAVVVAVVADYFDVHYVCSAMCKQNLKLKKHKTGRLTDK